MRLAGYNLQRTILAKAAGLVVSAALIFGVYAVVVFFRAFSSSGSEIGVETLNGVAPQ
jgi:hypothetical protein